MCPHRRYVAHASRRRYPLPVTRDLHQPATEGASERHVRARERVQARAVSGAWEDAVRGLEGIDLVRVVAASTDLMDRSRIAATVPGVVLVRSLMGVEADVVLVDVSHSALVAELRAVRSASIVGYAPHVDDAAPGAALAAGSTEVLARSVFFHRLSHLVAGRHPPEP